MWKTTVDVAATALVVAEAVSIARLRRKAPTNTALREREVASATRALASGIVTLLGINRLIGYRLFGLRQYDWIVAALSAVLAFPASRWLHLYIRAEIAERRTNRIASKDN